METEEQNTADPVVEPDGSGNEAPEPEVQAVDPYADLEYPVLVLVRKYADAIPVEVKDRAQLDRLFDEHGASVEIQR